MTQMFFNPFRFLTSIASRGRRLTTSSKTTRRKDRRRFKWDVSILQQHYNCVKDYLIASATFHRRQRRFKLRRKYKDDLNVFSLFKINLFFLGLIWWWGPKVYSTKKIGKNFYKPVVVCCETHLRFEICLLASNFFGLFCSDPNFFVSSDQKSKTNSTFDCSTFVQSSIRIESV